MRKVLALMAVAALVLTCSLALAQPKGAALMAEDVFTPLTKGYDLFRDGKYEAAQHEFEAALKADRYNPFALNNLATLMERQGKLKDAMAFLTDAQTHAADYKDKLEQTCFVGGLCAAAKPVKIVGPTSMIATVVADNMAKLKDKIAKTPAPPQPSTPPPMEAPKKK
jgi:Flp pilus assembly protein TadD